MRTLIGLSVLIGLIAPAFAVPFRVREAPNVAIASHGENGGNPVSIDAWVLQSLRHVRYNI